MATDPPTRSGSVLLLVAGLAALLLSLAVAFLIQVRADVGGMAVVAKDAQCRLMLSAALAYIQETARIGWGGTDPGAEAYGWTDIRDGQPGPRGPSLSGGARPTLGWSDGGTFPAPGAAMRGDAFCWVRPPYALQATATPTPLRLAPADADPAAISAFVGTYDANFGAKAAPVWRRMLDTSLTNGLQAVDAQPAAATWNDYATGVRQARVETAGLAWFRIYRELPRDHDGDGDPWYDTMPLSGHGVFVITVGSGGTRGYRFWTPGQDCLGGDANRTAPYSSPLDPVTASASGLFSDQAVFAEARANERIAWYRVEWTAFSGGGLDQNLAHGDDGMFLINSNYPKKNLVLNQGGTFRFIQRLEKEPPRW